MSWRDLPALARAVWLVWRGHASRIAVPGKFTVWREAGGQLKVRLRA